MIESFSVGVQLYPCSADTPCVCESIRCYFGICNIERFENHFTKSLRCYFHRIYGIHLFKFRQPNHQLLRVKSYSPIWLNIWSTHGRLRFSSHECIHLQKPSTQCHKKQSCSSLPAAYFPVVGFQQVIMICKSYKIISSGFVCISYFLRDNLPSEQVVCVCKHPFNSIYTD